MTTIKHEFVDTVPDKLEGGVLYVSIRFATVVHLCACGCGSEVVTPLSPTDWELRYDGESVSLYPSIGNYSFRCRSHYWIIEGAIQWAEELTDEEIVDVRRRDRVDKIAYYHRRQRTGAPGPMRGVPPAASDVDASDVGRDGGEPKCRDRG